MFSYFKKSKKQKDLFFQIKSELKKSDFEEDKIAGIYAIFKDDICLYVGQSKNIASRLATHLCGKYQECDKVLIYFSYEENDFNLIPTEKFAMSILKPIENVLVDFTEEIQEEELAESSILYEIDNPNTDGVDLLNCSDCIFINNKFDLFVSDDSHIDLYSNEKVLNFLKSQISSIEDHKGKNEH